MDDNNPIMPDILKKLIDFGKKYTVILLTDIYQNTEKILCS